MNTFLLPNIIQKGIVTLRIMNLIKEKLREKQEVLKEAGMDKVPEDDESGGCFIATAVYEGDDHFNLIVLRSFRDNFLDNYHYGKRFISFY